ncbi:MAG TPA: response regulator transcription factor [Anaerolineae bacterium]
MQGSLILLLEGKRAGGDSWAAALEKAGYILQVCHTGAAAFAWLAEGELDLIVFDASSMRSSGTRTCSRLRRAVGTKPIIHIRAEGDVLDQSAEADVYLEQPFTGRKLINRVRALLPADHSKEEVIRYGHITLYRHKRSVDVVGKGESRLTPKLARLLEEFVRYPNTVVSRRQLMQNVWKTDYIGDTRTLDVHVRWMRELIEEDPADPKYLLTVRGEGYIFTMARPKEG